MVDRAFRPVSKMDDKKIMLEDIMALLMGTQNTCRD